MSTSDLSFYPLLSTNSLIPGLIALLFVLIVIIQFGVETSAERFCRINPVVEQSISQQEMIFFVVALPSELFINGHCFPSSI